MKNDHSPVAGSAMIPRRQFLVLGSAAVVGAAATSLSANMVRGVPASEGTARVSAGFAPAAFADVQSPEFAPRALTAASHLRSGEAALAAGVRVKVHGMVRTDASAVQPVSMALDVMYRVPGQTEAVPFMAWSHAQLAGRKADSAVSSSVVPVGSRMPLSLMVTTGTVAGQNAKLQAKVDLALGSGRLANKLRSGLYFLALCPAGTAAPDWSSIRVVRSENALPLLRQATLFGLEPVSFDYIIVSADRA